MKATKCDACEALVAHEDALRLEVSLPGEVDPDGSESGGSSWIVDICRDCCVLPLNGVLNAACRDFGEEWLPHQPEDPAP